MCSRRQANKTWTKMEQLSWQLFHFGIRRGVKQGYVISPLLLQCYGASRCQMESQPQELWHWFWFGASKDWKTTRSTSHEQLGRYTLWATKGTRPSAEGWWVSIVATNLRGKTHQRSATKVFPLQYTILWIETMSEKFASSNPLANRAVTALQYVGCSLLGISWCLGQWYRPFSGCLYSGTGHQLDIGIVTGCVFFSSLLARCLTINGYWPASHGLVDHGGPCNATSELVNGASESAHSCHSCSKFYSALDGVRWCSLAKNIRNIPQQRQ